VAAHPLIVKRYRVLADAIVAGASPSIRNMATLGANLMQRNRCFYFYDLSCAECNRRNPGSGCAALLAQNGMNAVSGDSHHCIAAYPGDMAVALTALDALVIVRGRDRERSIPIDSFYKLPGNSSDLEHDLKTGELIVSVELPHSALRDPATLRFGTAGLSHPGYCRLPLCWKLIRPDRRSVRRGLR